MKEFEIFLKELFKRLAEDNDKVGVECANSNIYPAKVIGYSKKYMTIDVEFDADNLTKPESKLVEKPRFGYSMEPEYDCVVENVKVKEENVFWTNIKLT